MVDEKYERRVRKAAMHWLDAQNPAGSRSFGFGDVASFVLDGVKIPLLDHQRGIRKPAHMAAALSIRTTFTPHGQTPPYEDTVGADGLTRYKYRGVNPDHPENVALRTALTYRLPLIWFWGAARGLYVPIYPVWIIAEEPRYLQFVVAFDIAQKLVTPGSTMDGDQRQYVEQLTKQRLHQPVFRTQVLTAYEHQCAMCRLRYVQLLDAAHILPDGHPRGTPEVPNGLALCKIHHAAFDQNLLGVRSDFTVTVRSDVQLDRWPHARSRSSGNGRRSPGRSCVARGTAGSQPPRRTLRAVSACRLAGRVTR